MALAAAGGLRKKRNFKALALPNDPIIPNAVPATTNLEPTRNAPALPGGPRKRPPALPVDLDGTIHSGLPGGLGLGPLPLSDENPPLSDDDSDEEKPTLTSTLRSLDLEEKERGKGLRGQGFELKNEDLQVIQELGAGNGGSVVKVEHRPTGTIMAKKIVLIDAKQSVRKQILRELQIMHNCDSPYIISSYGNFLAEPNICICMEFMDKGSFDSIYKRKGRIEVGIVGVVATCVLEGLTYLYDVHRIIHRDIKPSNILCNSHGDIKLCDFGVSGELINSIANTFVGTSIYMSPERIQGGEYSVKSDVWSLGISIIELATGKFPFSDTLGAAEDSDDDSDLEDYLSHKSPDSPTTPRRDSLLPPSSAKTRKRRSKGVSLHGSLSTLSIIELMQQIVKEAAPRLPGPGTGMNWSKEAEDFVDSCLVKEIDQRKNPGELMKLPWIFISRSYMGEFRDWVEGI